MSAVFTRKFWADTAERAVSSVAQGALAAIGADQLNVIHAGWEGIASVALGAGVLAVLKAVAAARVGEPGTASLAPAPSTAEHRAG